MNTVSITVYDLSVFVSKLESFNRRAAKLGMAPASYEIIEQHTDTDRETGDVYRSWDIDLTHEVLSLPGGWKLLGTLDHTEHLIRMVPGESLPASYDAHNQKCDHCGHVRQRIETFIVINEQGETKQVGRNCLGDFLGINAAQLLRQIKLSKEMGEGWSGNRALSGHDLDFFLAHAATMIRKYGWTSRGAAQESDGKVATADATLSNIDNQREKRKGRWGDPLWDDPSEADSALASRTVAWMKNLSERSDLNDYLNNLRQIGENGFVTGKSAGFAASAISAMLKETEERTAAVTKRYLGEVGKKLSGEFVLVGSSGFDGHYGWTFVHRFHDSEGNVVIWKTGTELEQGLTYNLTATIKEHSAYRNVPQTVITRAKFV